jgi:hypothetical protein
MTAAYIGSPDPTGPMRFRDLLALAAKPILDYLPGVNWGECTDTAGAVSDRAVVYAFGRYLLGATRGHVDGNTRHEVSVLADRGYRHRMFYVIQRERSVVLGHKAPDAFFADEVILSDRFHWESGRSWEPIVFSRLIGELSVVVYSAAKSKAELDAYSARKKAEESAEKAA